MEVIRMRALKLLLILSSISASLLLVCGTPLQNEKENTPQIGQNHYRYQDGNGNGNSHYHHRDSSSGRWEYTIKVNIVNVTNPEEFLEAGPGAGGKAKLELNFTGPFVYDVKILKSGAVKNSNGSITFKTKKTYVFNAEKSIEADDKTLFTVPNVPYFSLIAAKSASAGLLVEGENDDELEDFLISASNAEPFVQRTAQELLWGYEDPLLKLMEEKGLRRSATWGLFLEDETSGSILTVASSSSLSNSSGNKYQDSYDTIQVINGQTNFDTWGNQYCDQINGTDFMDPHVRLSVHPRMDPVYYFNSQICRPFKFSLDTSGQNWAGENGGQLLRYAPDSEFFGSIADYPNNECFCRGHNQQLPCSNPGTFDLSKCKSKSNGIVISWPYFSPPNASTTYRNGRDLQTYDREEEHQQFLETDATSGKIESLQLSIQWNVQMEQNRDIPQSVKFTDVLIPVVQTTDSIEKVPRDQISNSKESDGYQVLDERTGRQASEPLELKEQVKDAKKVIKVVKALKKQKKRKSSASRVNNNQYHLIALPVIFTVAKLLSFMP